VTESNDVGAGRDEVFLHTLIIFNRRKIKVFLSSKALRFA